MSNGIQIDELMYTLLCVSMPAWTFDCSRIYEIDFKYEMVVQCFVEFVSVSLTLAIQFANNAIEYKKINDWIQFKMNNATHSNYDVINNNCTLSQSSVIPAHTTETVQRNSTIQYGFV